MAASSRKNVATNDDYDKSWSEVILISGSSGTGKTVLAQNLTRLLSDEMQPNRGGLSNKSDFDNTSGDGAIPTSRYSAKGPIMFVEGKFDQLIQYNPHSALSLAFSDLVERLVLEISNEDSETLKDLLTSQIPPADLQILSSFVPNIDKLSGALQSNASITWSQEKLTAANVLPEEEEQHQRINRQAFSKFQGSCRTFLRLVTSVVTKPIVVLMDDT